MNNKECLKMAREAMGINVTVGSGCVGVLAYDCLLDAFESEDEANLYADGLAQPVADLILKARAAGYDDGHIERFKMDYEMLTTTTLCADCIKRVSDEMIRTHKAVSINERWERDLLKMHKLDKKE